MTKRKADYDLNECESKRAKLSLVEEEQKLKAKLRVLDLLKKLCVKTDEERKVALQEFPKLFDTLDSEYGHLFYLKDMRPTGAATHIIPIYIFCLVADRLIDFGPDVCRVARLYFMFNDIVIHEGDIVYFRD